MILDEQTRLSDAQAFSATGVSTNTYDLGDITPRTKPGIGNPLAIGVTVDVAADFTTTDETYQFDVVTDEDPALGSPTVIASMIVAAADLAAGDKVRVPIPGDRVTERYLGLQMTLGGTTPSITLTADIAPETSLESYTFYASGFTIS